jgi:hypothetical protein
MAIAANKKPMTAARNSHQASEDQETAKSTFA